MAQKSHLPGKLKNQWDFPPSLPLAFFLNCPKKEVIWKQMGIAGTCVFICIYAGMLGYVYVRTQVYFFDE